MLAWRVIDSRRPRPTLIRSITQHRMLLPQPLLHDQGTSHRLMKAAIPTHAVGALCGCVGLGPGTSRHEHATRKITRGRNQHFERSLSQSGNLGRSRAWILGLAFRMVSLVVSTGSSFMKVVKCSALRPNAFNLFVLEKAHRLCLELEAEAHWGTPASCSLYPSISTNVVFLSRQFMRVLEPQRR
jgi:hypothetical protein